MVDPPSPPGPGEQYVLERELGRGAAAVVYLARDLKHRRLVALKMLDPGAGPVGDAARFHREIALVARLQHPHILALHDSGEVGGALYFVMPYVEGGSLRARLAGGGALAPADALRIAAELGDALAYAHARGVVHRDVKPENVLLSEDAPGGRAAGRWHAWLCDFGVARFTTRDSADRADGGVTGEGVTGEVPGAARMTRAGHALGTPIYMAPEQATGDPDVDGRADVWSLGVLLYEMLTGRPPHADAASPVEAMRRRLSGPVPTLGAPPGLPAATARAVNAVLARALAPDPAARYASADAFAADVRAAQATLTAVTKKRRARSWRAAAVAVVAATVCAGALAATGRALGWLGAGPAADPALIAVLPFADERGGAAPGTAAGADPNAAAGVDGRAAEQLLLGAMGRCAHLRLVNATRVNDALTRRGIAGPRTLDEAVAIARELGAGRLAWGTLGRPRRGPPDAVAVRAALYDVARPDNARREYAVHPAPAPADLGRRFAELADTLLLGTARSRVSVPGAFGTSSWGAWRAYDRGHDALARWDLAGAAAAFGEAAALDPDYALAHRWRAQAYAWMIDPPPAEWRQAAGRAAAAAGRMPPADGEASRGLAALAEGRYPDACRIYRALVRRDSLDFAAWYGLGDCQAKDSLVVRDPQSPSGWRFRSSYQGAIAAYRRTLGSLPSVHLAFGGRAATYLPRLLVTSGAQWRAGYAVDGADTLHLAAFPALEADTLAFTPYPLADHAAAQPWTLPPTRTAALTRNRQLLLAIAERWAQTFPRSPDAAELRAYALEALGQLDGPDPERPGALQVDRAALGLASGAQRRRIALSALRTLVKLQRFREVRLLADSLLAGDEQPRPEVAVDLAVVAALTGRASRAAELLRVASQSLNALPIEDLPVPPGPARAAQAGGLAFAALGAPRESVVVARGRALALVEGTADSATSGARRAYARQLMVLTFPDLRIPAPESVADGYFLTLQRLAARGDRTRLQDELRAVALRRQARGGAALSVDAAYQEAWLYAASGDTTGATEALDLALGTLAMQSRLLLSDVPRAASIGRAVALRSRLATRHRDAEVARRWSGALGELWRGADPAVLRANGLSEPGR